MVSSLTTPWKGVVNTKTPDGSIISDFLEAGIIPDAEKIPSINYNAQDFASYKESFTSYLKALYPLDYNNFAESDLGMMLVNLIAYLGANNSFKADFLANELFLPTVKTTRNLRKLLQLLGIDLRGPIASKADARVTAPAGFDVTGTRTISISPSNRTFAIQSKRDSYPLYYTLYEKNSTTGKVDILGDLGTGYNIVFTSGDHTAGSNTTFENLTLLEGRLKSEVGIFKTSDLIKTIQLTTASIIEGSIVVSSQSDGMWEEIDSIYLASGGSHQVFEKVYDDNFGVKLIFGDGVRGKLPTDGNSYIVYYRTGGGERGNIKSNFLNVTVNALTTGFAESTTTLTLQNISIATGGRNAESVENAKKYAPYKYKTQYRAVTGEDYNVLANTFISTAGGQAKCIPVLRQSGAGANIIDIYTLGIATSNQLERASLAFKQELSTYMNKDNLKMLTDEVVIVDGLVRTLDLIVTIHIDRTYEAVEENIKGEAKDIITKFFSVDNMDYGKTVVLTTIVKNLIEVPTIQFATIDNLEGNIYSNFNEIIQLNNLEINVEYI